MTDHMPRSREKACRSPVIAVSSVLIILFFLPAFTLFAPAALAVQLERPKKVLLHPFEPFPPYSITVNEVVRATCEYLDPARFPDTQNVRRLTDLCRRKYSRNAPDVIIAFLKPPLDFPIQYGPELFPDVLIVFCTVEKYQVKGLALGQNVTGLLMEIDPGTTLDIALKLHPETKRIVVISGAHANGRGYKETAREAFRAYEDRLDFLYMSAVPTGEVLQGVANLSGNTPVFYVTMLDRRRLQRRHITENRLPTGGMVRYKTATVRDMYGWPIIGLVAFLLIQSALIAVLVLQRIKLKRAEKTLLVTQFSLDHASDAVIGMDQDAKILYANKAACRRLGRSRDELLTMSVTDVNPDYTPSVWLEFMRHMEKHNTKTFEAGYAVKGGRSVPVEVRADLVEFEGQRYLLAFVRDITERKKEEKEIVDSRNFLQAVLTASPVGICNVRNRVVLWASESLCRMTGYSAEEITGSSSRFFYESDEEFNRVGGILYGQGWCETRVVRKDGSIMDCRIACYAMDGLTYVASIEDITERRRLESQLLQVQKMEAIGTLAGGVAHDFNNILSVVTGYAGLMDMKMEEDNPLKIYVQHILSSVDKAVYLTRNLLAFSREQVIDLKPINLNEAIERAKKILSRLIGEDIDLTTIPADDKPTILADCGQLDQVLMNLAANARDAMPQGGSLVIETSVAEIDEEFAAHQGFGKPGRYAVISVSDTGCGMDKKTQERIFEPFFTTKQVGKGTGLGLSMVYGIVKQHRGFMQVQSEVGRGTTITVYLPLADGEEQKKGSTEEILAGGTETILVAEDEEDLRGIITAILTNAGYTVIEAVDGEDAVMRFEERGDTIDLAVLDVVMPRMNGKEACDRIKSLKPGIPVLFASGYSDDIIQQKGVYDNKVDFIAKPLAPAELLKRIRRILDTWDN